MERNKVYSIQTGLYEKLVLLRKFEDIMDRLDSMLDGKTNCDKKLFGHWCPWMHYTRQGFVDNKRWPNFISSPDSFYMTSHVSRQKQKSCHIGIKNQAQLYLQWSIEVALHVLCMCCTSHAYWGVMKAFHYGSA